jgi:hypothetical protein
MGHDVGVYQNVIVPNDRTREGRIVFAPAADLAWRCGARVVNVSNSDVSDRSSRAAVKQHAISQSAADVEFWVDLEHSLAEATLKAASFRPDPIVCAASPPRGPKLLRRGRPVLSPVVAQLAQRADVPVVVIGPVTDTSRGLPMTEMVVVLDGTAEALAMVVRATEWAQQFKLRMVFTALSDRDRLRDRPNVQQYVDEQANSVTAPGGVGVELVQGSGGVDELVTMLADHEDAVVMMSPGPAGAALSRAATELILTSPRAVVLMR